MGDEPAGVLGELAEQVELDRSQVNLLAAAPDGAIRKVHLELADPDGRVTVFAPAAAAPRGCGRAAPPSRTA